MMDTAGVERETIVGTDNEYQYQDEHQEHEQQNVLQCFTPIQSRALPPLTQCRLCPSMDLIAVVDRQNDRFVVYRTVSWQKVVSMSLDCCTQLCWSPDGKNLAIGMNSGNEDGAHPDTNRSEQGKVVLYNLESGMASDDTDSNGDSIINVHVGQSITGLLWAHIGKPHPSWTLTDEEHQLLMEWR